MGLSPSARIASRVRATVPWKRYGGGVAGGSPRSTSMLWPWLARIRVPSIAKRRLSFVATTWSSS